MDSLPQRMDEYHAEVRKMLELPHISPRETILSCLMVVDDLAYAARQIADMRRLMNYQLITLILAEFGEEAAPIALTINRRGLNRLLHGKS